MINKALRLLLCILLFGLICFQTWLRAEAQAGKNSFHRLAGSDMAMPFAGLPTIGTREFTALVLPTLTRDNLTSPLIYTNDTSAMLYNAIAKKLGVRYRYFGMDDSGYDCSGFVWRVFQDAGASFDRVAARTLWSQLPRATIDETKQFGTLVFFNGVRHVGIVRDAYSFYHASRSQGVTLSFFAGYWGRRVTGFRRAPVSLIPEPEPIVLENMLEK